MVSFRACVPSGQVLAFASLLYGEGKNSAILWHLLSKLSCVVSFRHFVAPVFATCSAVDSNTLNLDPDPEYWPTLDPDPGLLSFLIKLF